MIRSFYKAKARFPMFSVHDLEIMRKALRNNERNGITGYLLREGSTYLNVIEGPKAAVYDLLDRIERDPRIYDFKILSSMRIEERQYPSWSMGYYEGGLPQDDTCPIKELIGGKAKHVRVEPAMARMRNLGLRQMENDHETRAV